MPEGDTTYGHAERNLDHLLGVMEGLEGDPWYDEAINKIIVKFGADKLLKSDGITDAVKEQIRLQVQKSTES